jgi:hypothetical protein
MAQISDLRDRDVQHHARRSNCASSPLEIEESDESKGHRRNPSVYRCLREDALQRAFEARRKVGTARNGEL